MEVRANLKPNRQTTEARKDSMKITKTTVYVEGDSSGNDSDSSVEVETDDEGGSIEEVELGQDDRESSDDDDGSEHGSQEDSDSEESGSDEQVPYTNGLQDDTREDLDGLDDSDIG
jgi:U3 small nucleolar RNA-associated protein 5